MPTIETTPELVQSVYEKMTENLGVIGKRLGRPLTLAEKILLSHLDDPRGAELGPGEAYIQLRPDRVAMQDATAQMAILQFMLSGRPTTAVPSTVHCDHLIQAYQGARADMETALVSNKEVYDFLRSASNKYGIGFWEPGAGIIHQVVLEHYAFPGGMMIGTDSHTPNAGGLGMIAVGVGGADAVDVMADFPWEVLQPELVGVRLSGELSGWTGPKDVIVKLCGILTVKGGTNRIIEYFGEGTRSISCTGKATITNMGAELGATTSLFPFDDPMDRYLRATGRAKVADQAKRYRSLLVADAEVEKNPGKYFDEVVEIDLSALEPQICGPHTPDLIRSVSEMAGEVQRKNYPPALSAALIGSCTNSSYEDICRVADVARQALDRGATAKVPLFVSPGSDQIFETIKRDGQMEVLEKMGATVLANACGPCIGQWKREDVQKGKRNSILTSFNRNFPRRNDGNPDTLAFIASPEIVVAYALAGRLDKDPTRDAIEGEGGKGFRLRAPRKAPDLPEAGFAEGRKGYLAPAEDGAGVRVNVAAESERIELLTPFEPWDGKDYEQMPVLIKARGKCTTDHISPAGPWLKFRGHLDHISDNLFIGVNNAFAQAPGHARNLLDGGIEEPAAKVARRYKAEGLKWVAVGDENYGEGSSREHAAMEPRHLGGVAVIVRSFARIHQSNLKKQGVLPLTFADPADYEKIEADDRITLRGLGDLAPSRPVRGVICKASGKEIEITLNHTLNEEQIEWFRAGSALGKLRQQ